MQGTSSVNCIVTGDEAAWRQRLGLDPTGAANPSWPISLATMSKHAGALKVVASGRISVVHIAVPRKRLLEQATRCARPANQQPARISNSRVVRYVHLLQEARFRQNPDPQCGILQT